MNLTEHFTLEELTHSEVSARAGISNVPPDALIPNLERLARGLERIRLVLQEKPILISSGYRSPRLNQMVGGSARSMHMQGLAADILCPQFGTPLMVCEAISREMVLDQIIHEFGRWCHVGFAADGQTPRAELLTIASSTRGYELGLKAV